MALRTREGLVECIVFDLDNTIYLNPETGEGSEEIKDRAWFGVFSEYDQDTLNIVLEAAKSKIVGGKGDRKDIVRVVLRHFGFPESQIPDEIDRRCEQFDVVVQAGIRQIYIPDEVKDSLRILSTLVPLYINTATPIDPALVSLDCLGLKDYFVKIFGRPGTKESNLRDIIATADVPADQVLFVDDQPAGWQIAQKIGCQFIGMRTNRNQVWRENPQPFPLIRSIADLQLLLLIS